MSPPLLYVCWQGLFASPGLPAPSAPCCFNTGSRDNKPWVAPSSQLVLVVGEPAVREWLWWDWHWWLGGERNVDAIVVVPDGVPPFASLGRRLLPHRADPTRAVGTTNPGLHFFALVPGKVAVWCWWVLRCPCTALWRLRRRLLVEDTVAARQSTTCIAGSPAPSAPSCFKTGSRDNEPWVAALRQWRHTCSSTL